MEWKRKKQDNGTFKTIARGMNNNIIFEILSIGGFMTVKRWVLSIFASYQKYPSIILTFYSLQDAKDFGNKMDRYEPIEISSINIGSGYN